jgi:hypothetical protein
LITLRGNRTYKPKAQETSGSLRSSLLINACLFSYKGTSIYRRPWGCSITPITPFPFLTNGFTHFSGYNSNSSLRMGHQRVFAWSSFLYTRRLLSLLRTTPFTCLERLHVACSSHEARATTRDVPSATKRPTAPLQPWEVSEASHVIPPRSAPEPSQRAGFLIDPHLRRRSPVMPNQQRASQHL